MHPALAFSYLALPILSMATAALSCSQRLTMSFWYPSWANLVHTWVLADVGEGVPVSAADW